MRKKVKIYIDDEIVFDATVDVEDMKVYEDLPSVLKQIINTLEGPISEIKYDN